MTVGGKQKAEDKRGPGKRPKVAMEEMEGAEGMESQQNEDRGLQLRAEIAEALLLLNDCLVSVKEELAVSWEAATENVQLLHHVLVHNLW